jgi:16S rRNA (uracil1498-N3)-methyltransferase
VTRPPLTHAPHVFVNDLAVIELDPADDHHLRVLRIRDGEPVIACDGAGAWRACRRTANGLAPDGDVVLGEREAIALSIAFALTKGDKPELVVQKLTELGVDRIVPLRCERSVVRWDDERAQRNVDRWRRVAREAAMQSRRVTLPVLDDVTTLLAIRAQGFVRAERDGNPMGLDQPAIAIGPEGGWSEAERAALASTCSLGPTVLRAETAAIAAASFLSVQRAQARSA